MSTLSDYNKPRPQVEHFARSMERRLRERDEKYGKLGYQSMSRTDLVLKLYEEYAELVTAICNQTADEIWDEAADLANICLFIADNFGGGLASEAYP